MNTEPISLAAVVEIPWWDQLIFFVGEITLFALLLMLIVPIIVAIIIFISIHNRHFYAPRMLKAGLVMSEGMSKAICRLLGVEDQELIAFFIRLHNTLSTTSFEATNVQERAIFIPQCLRAADCPAHLTPEGLVCRRCGRCEVGVNIDRLEKLGYRVWIAPGSTLIKRMFKKYHPKAIVGVGCLMEVKEGIEMCDKAGIVAMGVVTIKDGCVETLVNWPDVYDVALLGTEEGEKIN
ncbi:MAG: DUF116 domain-containing protein [Methanomicrobiales archaeon]|jgi:hypothetical protein|nr:DUF116 domain-containing protein [Methanomicrobiales archaeon]